METTDQAPEPSAEIEAAATAERLGRRRASYGPWSRTAMFGTRTNVVLALGALPLIAWTALSDLYLLVIGVPVFGVGLLVLVTNRLVDSRNARRELHIFDQGLVLGVSGVPRNVFRWDSMTVLQDLIRHQSYGGIVTHSYILRRPDGAKVLIGKEFFHPEVWGPQMQQFVAAAQAPQELQRINTGETVAFGPLKLTREGVHDGRRSARWADVDLKVSDGDITITGERNRFLAYRSISTIPNFYVFLTLARHLMGSR